MIKFISSKDNKLFKQYKNLLNKKYRDKYDKYIIEGIRFTKDAIDKNKDIETIILSESKKELANEFSGFNIIVLSDECFLSVSDTVNSQGVVAVINKDKNVKDEISGPVLILDRLQDPGNLGTIIRTANAAGFKRIILSKGSADLYNSKVLRSTAGAIFNINFMENVDLIEEIRGLKSLDYVVIGASLNAKEFYNKVKYTKKTAIIIGNEGSGISEEILKSTDFNIKIPIYSDVESLNASVAAALILYEIGNQLNK